MKIYSAEYKASIIARMLPPNNADVADLAEETHIPKDTLYCWRSKARRDAGGAAVAATPASELSSEEKFAIVVETAALNEMELSEYCRCQGLYPQQLEAWRTSCLQANAVFSSKRERPKVRERKLQIETLERELRRKEKALAALLVLRKKTKSPCDLGGPRGRKIDVEQRRKVSTLIEDACAAGARLDQACKVLDFSVRTLQRWREDGEIKDDARAGAAH